MTLIIVGLLSLTLAIVRDSNVQSLRGGQKLEAPHLLHSLCGRVFGRKIDKANLLTSFILSNSTCLEPFKLAEGCIDVALI